jgi:hypothetical protein
VDWCDGGGGDSSLYLLRMMTDSDQIKFTCRWMCRFYYIGRGDVESCLSRPRHIYSKGALGDGKKREKMLR